MGSKLNHTIVLRSFLPQEGRVLRKRYFALETKPTINPLRKLSGQEEDKEGALWFGGWVWSRMFQLNGPLRPEGQVRSE